jgi:hypothetical protein
MEIADLASNYQSKSDEELIRLAEDTRDLSPEAKEVLANELSKRGITSVDIDAYSTGQEEIRKQEKQRRLDALFPSARGVVAKFAGWKEFKIETGLWPTRSIAFSIVHGLLDVVALLAVVTFGVVHGWSKLKFLAVLMPLALVDVLLSGWLASRIRLFEIARYRATRHS